MGQRIKAVSAFIGPNTKTVMHGDTLEIGKDIEATQANNLILAGKARLVGKGTTVAEGEDMTATKKTATKKTE